MKSYLAEPLVGWLASKGWRRMEKDSIYEVVVSCSFVYGISWERQNSHSLPYRVLVVRKLIRMPALGGRCLTTK